MKDKLTFWSSNFTFSSEKRSKISEFLTHFHEGEGLRARDEAGRTRSVTMPMVNIGVTMDFLADYGITLDVIKVKYAIINFNVNLVPTIC